MRRGLLALSLLGNLGVLAFFKYGPFFADNVGVLLSDSGVPSVLHDIALPIGISFYTFQSVSYSIDVYRNDLQPSKRFLDVTLYVSFFPQLVAGPIVRATAFIPFMSRPICNWSTFRIA